MMQAIRMFQDDAAAEHCFIRVRWTRGPQSRIAKLAAAAFGRVPSTGLEPGLSGVGSSHPSVHDRPDVRFVHEAAPGARHRAEPGLACQPPHLGRNASRWHRLRGSGESGRNLSRWEAQEHFNHASQATDWLVGRTAVAGARGHSTNQVAANAVPGADRQTLQGFVKDHADRQARVRTDEASGHETPPFELESVKH